MRKLKFINKVIIPFCFILTNCNNDSKTENLKAEEQSFSAKEIYAMTVNKTVTIITEKGLGSGFYIDSNIIITNYHVIKDAIKIEVALNNSDKKYIIKNYLAVDKINDLILLQSEWKSNDFVSLEDIMPEPGEKVFAIGSPIGLSKTISEGIISGIRDFGDKKLLQITAPISHGSSGCPIINLKGKLIGVAVSGVDEASNIGFCVPTNILKTLLLFKSRYPKEIINSEFQESKAELQNTKKAERDDQPHQEQKKAAYYNDLAGDKWRRYKDYKGAIEAFNKSLQLDPTNWNVLSSRAVCKFEFKDYKGVISDVNATLEMQPGYTHLIYYRCISNYELGNKDDACLDLKLMAGKYDDHIPNEINEYCN